MVRLDPAPWASLCRCGSLISLLQLLSSGIREKKFSYRILLIKSNVKNLLGGSFDLVSFTNSYWLFFNKLEAFFSSSHSYQFQSTQYFDTFRVNHDSVRFHSSRVIIPISNTPSYKLNIFCHFLLRHLKLFLMKQVSEIVWWQLQEKKKINCEKWRKSVCEEGRTLSK